MRRTLIGALGLMAVIACAISQAEKKREPIKWWTPNEKSAKIKTWRELAAAIEAMPEAAKDQPLIATAEPDLIFGDGKQTPLVASEGIYICNAKKGVDGAYNITKDDDSGPLNFTGPYLLIDEPPKHLAFLAPEEAQATREFRKRSLEMIESMIPVNEKVLESLIDKATDGESQ